MEHLGTRLAAGDEAAFAEVHGVLADRLHHYLAVRLGARTDADDVLQETFVRPGCGLGARKLETTKARIMP